MKACQLSVTLILLLFCSLAFGANISGVMGTKVTPNDRSLQFRLALSPADEGFETDDWAYRMHYQHAFTDTLKGRVVFQFRDKEQFEYDFFRTELLYNFKQQTAGEIWSSALRFDFRTRRGGRPEELAVNWGNQWDLNNSYRVRSTLIFAQHIGPNSTSKNLIVQTRGSVSKKLNNGIRVGIQILNKHGEIGNFASLDEQSFEIGPAISGKIGQVKYEFRYLHGLTDASRNHNFFLRFSTAL